jgi:hypothetical protein
MASFTGARVGEQTTRDQKVTNSNPSAHRLVVVFGAIQVWAG